MKWFDRWLYRKVRDMWDNRHKYQEDEYINTPKGLNMVGAQAISKAHAEGDDRITFELTSAIGGRILNVRHYDHKHDRHETTTYVIPTGEDVGARVSKILNLELLK